MRSLLLSRSSFSNLLIVFLACFFVDSGLLALTLLDLFDSSSTASSIADKISSDNFMLSNFFFFKKLKKSFHSLKKRSPSSPIYLLLNVFLLTFDSFFLLSFTNRSDLNKVSSNSFCWSHAP